MTRTPISYVVQVCPIAGTWRTTDGPNHFDARHKAEGRLAQLQRRSPRRSFRIIETTISTTQKAS